jgi:hypothetical protein
MRPWPRKRIPSGQAADQVDGERRRTPRQPGWLKSSGAAPPRGEESGIPQAAMSAPGRNPLALRGRMARPCSLGVVDGIACGAGHGFPRHYTRSPQFTWIRGGRSAAAQGGRTAGRGHFPSGRQDARSAWSPPEETPCAHARFNACRPARSPSVLDVLASPRRREKRVRRQSRPVRPSMRSNDHVPVVGAGTDHRL